MNDSLEKRNLVLKKFNILDGVIFEHFNYIYNKIIENTLQTA